MNHDKGNKLLALTARTLRHRSSGLTTEPSDARNSNIGALGKHDNLTFHLPCATARERHIYISVRVVAKILAALNRARRELASTQSFLPKTGLSGFNSIREPMLRRKHAGLRRERPVAYKNDRAAIRRSGLAQSRLSSRNEFLLFLSRRPKSPYLLHSPVHPCVGSRTLISALLQGQDRRELSLPSHFG